MQVSTIVRRLVILVVLLAWAAPATAQRTKWWHDDRFRRELGLTAEQSARLEEVFQNTQPTLRQRMDALAEAERVFDRIVERSADDIVMQQVDIVESARAELNKARTMMLLRMRRALTADQWAKFTALAQADREAERAGAASRSDGDRRPSR